MSTIQIDKSVHAKVRLLSAHLNLPIAKLAEKLLLLSMAMYESKGGVSAATLQLREEERLREEKKNALSADNILDDLLPMEQTIGHTGETP